MDDVVGLWTLESRDNNFDQFMQCRGASWFLRNLMGRFIPDVEYTLSEDRKTLTKKTITSMKTMVYPMAVDEEFIPDKTLSGKAEYGRVTETSGRKVLQEMRFQEDNEIAALIERQVIDGKMIVTLRCKDIVCQEIYKKKE